jgi:hypothetical protein
MVVPSPVGQLSKCSKATPRRKKRTLTRNLAHHQLGEIAPSAFVQRREDDNQSRNLAEKRAQHFIAGRLDRPYWDRLFVSPLVNRARTLFRMHPDAASRSRLQRPSDGLIFPGFAIGQLRALTAGCRRSRVAAGKRRMNQPDTGTLLSPTLRTFPAISWPRETRGEFRLSHRAPGMERRMGCR